MDNSLPSTPRINNNSLNDSLNITGTPTLEHSMNVTGTPNSESDSDNLLDSHEERKRLLTEARRSLASNNIGLKDVYEQKTIDPLNIQILSLNMFDKMAGAPPCWRADAHDGTNLSKNIIFDTKINNRVIEEISFKDKFPVIKIISYKIVKSSLLLIKDFSTEQIVDYKINFYDLIELSNSFFTKLRGGLPGTPSRMP